MDPDPTDAAQAEAADSTSGAEDYSHLFRREGIVAEADLRVDVAHNFARFVAGDEEITVDVDESVADASMSLSRGARTRVVGDLKRTVIRQETLMVGERIDETVHGGVHQMAKFAAEAMVGGAYTNTIAGPYLRTAGWVDFLAWGGWAEVDMVRAELSLLMIRSHVGYAHAAGVRATAASRLIDDFQNRTETFGIFNESGAIYTDAGAPGGGITNEA